MIIPYLSFNGKCAEALEFYKKVFNAPEPRVLRYGDAPADSGYPVPDAIKNYVMHSEIKAAGSSIYLCDSPDPVEMGDGMIINADFQTEHEAVSAFTMLKEGGIVHTEIGSSFFSKLYGAVCDKYGVNWFIHQM